jgi:hypothetical protein
MIDLQVFDKFWINCWFNSLFSIITSIDNSYEEATYLNSYSFMIEERMTPLGTRTTFFRLDMHTHHSELLSGIVDTVPIHFKQDISTAEQVIEILKSNFLFLCVDLFNWIPDSICWQKHHWEHYTLVKGYDPVKDIFTVLDENKKGYGVHEITRENLENSSRGTSMDFDGLVAIYKEDIEPYKMDYHSVLENAYRLTSELKILLDDYWTLSIDDIKEGHMLDLYSMYCYGVSNRHIANMLLIESLRRNSYINDNMHAKLTALFKELKEGWEAIKFAFIKANSFTPRKLDVKSLSNFKNVLVNKELDAWKMLLP